MAKRRTVLQVVVTPEIYAIVDKHCDTVKISRSSYLSRIIEKAIHTDPNVSADTRALALLDAWGVTNNDEPLV